MKNLHIDRKIKTTINNTISMRCLKLLYNQELIVLCSFYDLGDEVGRKNLAKLIKVRR